MEFSEDIKQLLKDKFPDKDMYSMSKDELIQFREEVVELREEYNLLEMAMKIRFNLGCLGRLQIAPKLKDIYFIRFIVWVKSEMPCIYQIKF